MIVAGEQRQRGGELREAIGPIGAATCVERDGSLRLMHLHVVAVEFDLVGPAFAFGQPVSRRRLAGSMAQCNGGERHEQPALAAPRSERTVANWWHDHAAGPETPAPNDKPAWRAACLAYREKRRAGAFDHEGHLAAVAAL